MNEQCYLVTMRVFVNDAVIAEQPHMQTAHGVEGEIVSWLSDLGCGLEDVKVVQEETTPTA